MENFIVRVYRRDDNNPDTVVGVLENVETQQQRPFHNLVSLCRMLSHPVDAMQGKTSERESPTPSSSELKGAGLGRSR